MVDLVDLRSDTVTRPTPAMRRAMAEAEVGDDQLGDDPTVERLQEEIASLLGKERALFFPTGTMANQTALAVLAGWGGEAVCEADCHILNFEDAAAAAIAGVQLRPVPTPDGLLTAELVSGAIRPHSRYLPRTRVLALENTHLSSGGRVHPPDAFADAAGGAREAGVAVHLDGARLWHACAETGLPPTAWTDHVDTVMVALSKGLGCPVGSLLAGPAAEMEEAWRIRRRLGGSMRQSGILAAAGLHALEHHLGRLPEDHEHARALAAALDGIPGVHVSPPETNIVIASLEAGGPDPDDLLSFLDKHRILMLKFGPRRVRAVCHRDVGGPEIARTVGILADFPRRGHP